MTETTRPTTALNTATTANNGSEHIRTASLVHHQRLTIGSLYVHSLGGGACGSSFVTVMTPAFHGPTRG
jgi:hypothetical protein